MRIFQHCAGVVALAVVCSCGVAADKKDEKKPVPMKVTSSAFQEGQPLPAKYTCDGENISPPLKWADAPAGTKSFTLICDDPDAPIGTWVHWVIYDLPATTTEL